MNKEIKPHKICKHHGSLKSADTYDALYKKNGKEYIYIKCRLCKNASGKKYRDKTNYNEIYYKENADKIVAQHRIYRNKNRKLFNEKWLQYAKANREKCNEWQNRWRDRLRWYKKSLEIMLLKLE
jgi:hypothetical protein